MSSNDNSSTKDNNTLASTLQERGGRYGSFSDNANIAQSIKDHFRSYREAWEKQPPYAKEALDNIAAKIARMFNGDEYYPDNWHDIAGYAKLVDDILVQKAYDERLNLKVVGEIQQLVESIETAKAARVYNVELLNYIYRGDAEHATARGLHKLCYIVTTEAGPLFKVQKNIWIRPEVVDAERTQVTYGGLDVVAVYLGTESNTKLIRIEAGKNLDYLQVLHAEYPKIIDLVRFSHEEDFQTLKDTGLPGSSQMLESKVFVPAIWTEKGVVKSPYQVVCLDGSCYTFIVSSKSRTTPVHVKEHSFNFYIDKEHVETDPY